MLLRIMQAALSVYLLTFLTTASATVIGYKLAHLGDNDWRYRYTIENDTLGLPIRGITIYFSESPGAASPAELTTLLSEDELAAAFDELVELASPSGTEGLRALGATGVDLGMTAGTLIVEFKWWGNESPAAQFFEVFRYTSPNDFDPSEVLDSGFTTPIGEPTTFVLLTLGVMLIVFAHHRGSSAPRH